jgi:AcrR family transcriptional regulator
VASSAPAGRYERLKPGARRAQLLELGLRLFSERAYDDFSMDDLAAAAGVSKGLLFHYFGSKRDFYAATLRLASEDLMARTEPPENMAPAERLLEGLRAYLTYVAAHPASYRAVLRGGIGSDEEVVAIADRVRETMVERVLAGLGLASATPEVRLVIRGWVGFVEAASLEWVESRRLPQEQVVTLLADQLRAGLEIAGAPVP